MRYRGGRKERYRKEPAEGREIKDVTVQVFGLSVLEISKGGGGLGRRVEFFGQNYFFSVSNCSLLSNLSAQRPTVGGDGRDTFNFNFKPQ